MADIGDSDGATIGDEVDDFPLLLRRDGAAVRRADEKGGTLDRRHQGVNVLVLQRPVRFGDRRLVAGRQPLLPEGELFAGPTEPTPSNRSSD